MPVVRMPDGALVEMPENPTPQQLEGLRKVQMQGNAAEVGRTADKIVRGGLAATPGMLGDVALAGMRQLDKTPIGPAGPLLAIPQLAARLFGNPTSDTKFGDVTSAIERGYGVLPPKSEPQSEAGKAVANVLEPAVATVAGGGAGTVGQKLLVGLGAGAGGEGAARAFGDNPLVRFLGSLLGGGAVGIGQSIKSNSENITRQATEQMTPNDWRRAKVLEATLEKEGIPHLKSQLLGPRSTLDDTVAIAGTNPAVRPRLVTQVENSAEQAQQAYKRFALQNLPPSLEERPQVLQDIQGASEAAIEVLKNKGRAAYRNAMPPQEAEYPKEYVQAIHDALIDLAKSPKYGETSAAGKAITKVAGDLMLPGGKVDTSGVNPTALLRAQKEGVDVSTLPGATVAREFVTNQHKINNLIKELNLKVTKEDYKGLPIDDVKRVLKDLTPEFQPARDAMSAVYASEVNPVQRGLTGQIAQMGGGLRPDKATAKKLAMELVFPPDYEQPQAIRELAKQIGGEGVGQLLRENLARNMQEAVSLKLNLGDQVQGPFNFVRQVARTEAQQKNLKAAIWASSEAIGANPGAVHRGFYKLLQAFETTKDLKLPETIDRAALAQEAGKTLPGFVVAPNSRLGRYFWERATASTYNKIADMVLSKDGLKQLEAIARSEKPETARQAAIGIITSTMASEAKE